MSFFRKHIANAFTIFRLLLTPFLMHSIFDGSKTQFLWFAVGIMATDVVDGGLARALQTESQLGRILDSVADAFFYPTFVLGTVVFLRLTTPVYAWVLIGLLAFTIICIVVMPLILVGRMTFIHLRAWQISTYIFLLFAIISLLWHLYLPLLYLYIFICILGGIETIAICARDRKQTDDSVHSFFEKSYNKRRIVRSPK